MLQDLAHLLHKVGDHDGLGQEAVHAAFQGVAAVLVKGVRRHGKNGDARQGGVFQLADAAGGGESAFRFLFGKDFFPPTRITGHFATGMKTSNGCISAPDR